jgi:hypothetical protein
MKIKCKCGKECESAEDWSDHVLATRPQFPPKKGLKTYAESRTEWHLLMAHRDRHSILSKELEIKEISNDGNREQDYEGRTSAS